MPNGLVNVCFSPQGLCLKTCMNGGAANPQMYPLYDHCFTYAMVSHRRSISGMDTMERIVLRQMVFTA